MSFWIFWADSKVEDVKDFINEIENPVEHNIVPDLNLRIDNYNDNFSTQESTSKYVLKTEYPDVLTFLCNYRNFIYEKLDWKIPWILFFSCLVILVYFLNAIWVAPLCQKEKRVVHNLFLPEVKYYWNEKEKISREDFKLNEKIIPESGWTKKRKMRKSVIDVLYLFDNLFCRFNFNERILLSYLVFLWSIIVTLAGFYGHISLLVYSGHLIRWIKKCHSKNPVDTKNYIIASIFLLIILILMYPSLIRELMELWKNENFGRYFLQNIIYTRLNILIFLFVSTLCAIFIAGVLFYAGKGIYKLYKKIRIQKDIIVGR